MIELVDNLKVVFRDRLQKLDWMSDPTRAKALAKFDRFTQKIGHPEKFRDYSTVKIVPDDYSATCAAPISSKPNANSRALASLSIAASGT